jgi:hypothetical protein
MLNLFPIIYFIFVLFRLACWNLEGSCERIAFKIFIIMLQPFVLFGFYWVWVAIIKWCSGIFYPPKPLDCRQYPNLLEERDLNPANAWKILFVGIIYIGLPCALLLRS